MAFPLTVQVPVHAGTRGPLSERVAALDLAHVDTDELAAILASEGARLFAGRRGVLWFYEPLELRLVAADKGHEPQTVAVSDAEINELTSEVALDSASPVHRRLRRASFGADPVETDKVTLVIPIGGLESCIGALVVGDCSPTGPSEPDAFARQAAAALSNHRALVRGRQHEVQLEALYQTAGELSSELELGNVLRAIISRARDLLGTTIGYIMLVDRASDEIYMTAAVGVSNPGFTKLRLRIGTGLGGMAARERKPFYTSDYLNDDRYRHQTSVDREVRGEGIRSILGVPIHTRGEFVGVLYVAERDVRPFSPDDIELLSSLGHHAAIAIGNARLYEQAMSGLTEISRANELVRSQNEQLRRVDEAHRQLSDVVLTGLGLNAIVALIADLVGAPVVALDHRHRVLVSAGTPTDTFGTALHTGGVAREVGSAPDVARAIKAIDGSAVVVLPPAGVWRERARIIVPVIARAEVLGSLWVEAERDALPEQRPILEQAARVVALELLKERSVREVERRLRRELLDELLAERPPPTEVLARRAADVDVDLSVPYRLCVIRTPSRAVVEDVVGGLRLQRGCAFAAQHAGYVVALLHPAERVVDEIRELMDSFGDEGSRPTAAVSSECATPAAFRASFTASIRVLELLGDETAPPVLDLDETRILALLFREGGSTELRAFVDSCLSPLARRDPEGRLDLVTTLETFLTCGCSPVRAAAQLHVHVNTIYYRLTRLKSALGDDFASPRRALDLQVACLGRRLLWREPPEPPGGSSEIASMAKAARHS